MTHNPRNEKSINTAWTPDLFGPVFKKKRLTVRQALHLRNVNEQIHRMATFVPDEIIYENLSEKSLRSFRAVLMFLNISDFSTLFKNFIHDKNGGCLALTKTLNDYIHIVVREVYCSAGDILKFSAEGILIAWKVHDGEFIYNIVQTVIISAMNIQNSITVLQDSYVNVNVTISAGDVKFSVIGDDEGRHFVIYGAPIEELKNANKISLPNDLILSLSAWQHCQPSQYEYVIKNPYNIKIIKMAKQSDIKSTYMTSPNRDDISYEPPMQEKFIINIVRQIPSYRTHLIPNNGDSETEIANNKEKISTAIMTIAAANPNFSTQLKSYLIKPVIQQIEEGESLKFLAEIRRITVISIDIIPIECSVNELILLIDKCFLLLLSIVTPQGGYINTMDLYKKHIYFCIVFGIRGCTNNENQFKIDETCKNGIICAAQILQTVKTIVEIQSIFIGMSTGIAYCGVIGHIARRYYAIIGPPIDKAINIMDISYNKVINSLTETLKFWL